MKSQRDIWFPAKRYGWGWGPPVKWQGWAALFLYVAGVLVIAFRFPPSSEPVTFIVLVLLATLAFILVCWWKGETPRWRWGGKDHE